MTSMLSMRYYFVLFIEFQYCVENNLELPILEMLCFIFSYIDIKRKICQNITQIAVQDQIAIYQKLTNLSTF